MKELKEKSFTVDVELSEKYPDVVQIMLERLYNEGRLRYDNVYLTDREVVSEKHYKGLTYGNISEDALVKKQLIEEDGYQLEYIFTIAEKQRDPFIDCYGSRPDEYCILEDVRYALKLKFSFTKVEEVNEGEDQPPAKPAAKEKINHYMFPRAKVKYIHKQKTKTTAPF